MLQMPELLGVPRLEEFDDFGRGLMGDRPSVERYLAQQGGQSPFPGPESGYGPGAGQGQGQWDGRGRDAGSMVGVGAGGAGVNVIGTRRSMDQLSSADGAQRRSNNRMSTLSTLSGE